MKFNLFYLDLDVMTLVLKVDLNIVKMYGYTENEVPGFSYSLNRETDIITYLHKRMVTIACIV